MLLMMSVTVVDVVGMLGCIPYHALNSIYWFTLHVIIDLEM
jgi:hypothetical protein